MSDLTGVAGARWRHLWGGWRRSHRCPRMGYSWFAAQRTRAILPLQAFSKPARLRCRPASTVRPVRILLFSFDHGICLMSLFIIAERTFDMEVFISEACCLMICIFFVSPTIATTYLKNVILAKHPLRCERSVIWTCVPVQVRISDTESTRLSPALACGASVGRVGAFPQSDMVFEMISSTIWIMLKTGAV